MPVPAVVEQKSSLAIGYDESNLEAAFFCSASLFHVQGNLVHVYTKHNTNTTFTVPKSTLPGGRCALSSIYNAFHLIIPCRPRPGIGLIWLAACTLQSCLSKNTYSPDKCDEHLRRMYLCCQAMYERGGEDKDKPESTACPMPNVVSRWLKIHLPSSWDSLRVHIKSYGQCLVLVRSNRVSRIRFHNAVSSHLPVSLLSLSHAASPRCYILEYIFWCDHSIYI